MRPPSWRPPIELSPEEEKVITRIKKAKLFIFLRNNRHNLFNEELQLELATIFKNSTVGQCPIPPAQLGLALILQAYTGISDDEVIEVLVMDRRWQLVLDCLDCQQPPFSKGTLVNFRRLLINKGLDQRLIERTVEIAKEKGGFNSGKLRAALDSSPLWGAGKVEDTYNLLGHTLKKAVRLMASAQGRSLEDVASEVGAEKVFGSSFKAALDLNWDDPEERSQALEMLLNTFDMVEEVIEKKMKSEPLEIVKATLEAGREIEDQNVTVDEKGKPKLKTGVAPNRRISIEDPQMRHGRKSSRQRFDGYKRHVLRDLDIGVVRAVGVTAANLPEATVTEALALDLEGQKVELVELHIDRAYLSSEWVRKRDDNLKIFCKAWSVRNGECFDKTAFILDWDKWEIKCPNQITIPFAQGKVVKFPQQECAICPLQERCTTSKKGRSVSIHPDEALMQELRERQSTVAGRVELRQRSAVEHTLAHVGQWQGNQARYLGQPKNLFDLRRVAVVHNLHVIARMKEPAAQQQQAV
jgi:hypothetical protein